MVSSLYNIVDQIFIGQGVGYLGNAATNVFYPFSTICLAISLLIGIGSDGIREWYNPDGDFRTCLSVNWGKYVDTTFEIVWSHKIGVFL